VFKTDNDGLWILSGPLEPEVCARIYDAAFNADPSQPVHFAIDSPGGDALFTLALVEALRPLQHLETRGLGEVCSAALWLLQAGKHRSCYRVTSFLAHQVYTEGSRLNADSAPGYARTFESTASSAADMLARRTKKKARFWRDFVKTDRWFGAEEALKLGLVDEIL